MPGPYLTTAELVNAPTGINWANLPVTSATLAQQQDQQTLLINTASSWCDDEIGQDYAAGAEFTLSATTNTETVPLVAAGGTRAVFLRDGTFVFYSRFVPVVAVNQVQFAPDGATYNVLPWTALVEGKQKVRIVPPPSGTIVLPGLWGWPDYGWLKVTTVNGFPNTTLNGAHAAGATSLAVLDATGFQAGQTIRIYDGPGNDEAATIASSWVMATGAQSLPLVTALAKTHASGTPCASMPQYLRQATIYKVVDLVRERGADTVTIGTAGRGRPMLARGQQPASTIDKAKECLRPLRRVI